MKRYNEYFDSQDIWLGEIPKNWDLANLKFYVEIINGYAFKSEDYSDDSGVPIIRIGDISSDLRVSEAKKANPQNISELDRFLIKKGDLLLAMTGATIGKNCMYQSSEIAYVNQRVGLLRSKNGLDQGYLKFFIDTPFFREFISLACSGSAQENISSSEISELKICVPPFQEQTQIARYLDHQTSLIDEIVKGKEKLLELLKEKRQAVINEVVTKGLDPNARMKDSGIDWLGEIPEHWKIVKLKQVAETYGRIGYRGYTTADIVLEGEGAITISPSNMKGDFMTFEDSTYISWAKYEESPEIQIYDNDVLMVKTGSTYGKVGLVKTLEKKATINPQILVFKNIQINPDYFYNILRTPFIQHQVETNVIGSTIPTISQAKILNFQLVLPPANEINSILSFINTFMKKIDDLNIQLLSQIQKLKEYRQSLISEAVTGKVDVQDWNSPNVD
jgi:type I restriction enzyme S subunit